MSQASSRTTFLQRVRAAVAAGNGAGRTPGLPDRGNIGYQGAGTDPISHFREALTTAGANLHVVSSAEDARQKVIGLIDGRTLQRVLLGCDPLLDSLNLADPLRARGLAVDVIGDIPSGSERKAFFAADLAISGADYLIAETGTIVACSRPEEPRSLSLLAPIHIVVAHRRQLLPDLFDLFDTLDPTMPSCIALITGPSKTGDIELRLVTGVHGPGEVHLVLIDVTGNHPAIEGPAPATL